MVIDVAEEVTPHGHSDRNEHSADHRERVSSVDPDQGPTLRQYQNEVHRLRSIEREYRVTVRVMAVLAEQLLNSSWAREPGLTELSVTDDAIVNAPEIVAWRDEPNGRIMIKVRPRS